MHAQLESAFQKLIFPLNELTRMAPGALEISVPPSALTRHDPIVFKKLSEALIDQHEISFDYRKPQEKKPARRRVRPYHLTSREGTWYLIAYDTSREAIRTFALSRIIGLEVNKTSFERPTDFTIEAYFKHTIGVVHGNAQYAIRLRFDEFAAPYLRERFIHDSQKFIDLPNGELELQLVLNDLIEAERIILKWGGHAEALAPKELRRRVARASGNLAKLHPLDETEAET